MLYRFRKPERGNRKARRKKRIFFPQSPIRNPRCHSPPVGIARIATLIFAHPLPVSSVSTIRSGRVLNVALSVAPSRLLGTKRYQTAVLLSEPVACAFFA